MAQASYCHATLCLHGTLIVTEDEQPGGIKVAVGLGDIQVPVGVKKSLAALLQDKPPEGEQGIIVWPRTDKEGLLGNGTQLALYKDVGELDRERGLHALGELVKVDRENALLQLQDPPERGAGEPAEAVQAAADSVSRAAGRVA